MVFPFTPVLGCATVGNSLYPCSCYRNKQRWWEARLHFHNPDLKFMVDRSVDPRGGHGLTSIVILKLPGLKMLVSPFNLG